MQNKYERQRIVYCTYGVLALGIFLGSLLFLIAAILPTAVLDYGLEEYGIEAMVNLPVKEMMIYILKKRGLQIVFFLLVTSLYSFTISSGLYNFTLGGYYGIVISNLIIKYNFHGFLYGMVCFFPHYFFYFIAIYLFGKWNVQQLNEQDCYHRNVKKLQYFFKKFVIFSFVILGVIWEIYFQKNFLGKFYQYLV